MALPPLDATPGGPSSNSFVTVARAIDLQTGRTGAATFAALPQADQEALLMRATQDISLTVHWYGAPVDPLQALPLPMLGQVDGMGRLLPTDIIPPLVEQATALYALVLMSSGGDVTISSAAIEHLRKGDTEVWYHGSVQTAIGGGTLPLEIWTYLRPYGQVPQRGRQAPVFRG